MILTAERSGVSCLNQEGFSAAPNKEGIWLLFLRYFIVVPIGDYQWALC